MKTLVLNVGSSSLKCWFRNLPDGRLWTAQAQFESRESLPEVLEQRLQSLWEGEKKAVDSPLEIDVVGHRIVHGGPKYRESAVATPEVREGIAQQAEFAPAHNRLELAAIQTVDRVIGADVPQVVVFDTAFHATLAPAAYVYPGPYSWLDQSIRRYGFHGISVQYATRRASELLQKPAASLRLIVCHLGNGASVTAVANGRSVDTSMGFTPLEGIMMGTRSGSVDPSILVYLARLGKSAEELDQMLNDQSGLFGISGLSGDMREILGAMDKGHTRARLAYEIYAHRLTREIGSMLAVLGGADAIVFTGGIGENCVPLRQDVCRKFEFTGLKLDGSKNARPQLDQNLAAAGSSMQVLVIRADEDGEIARECQRLADAGAFIPRHSAQQVRV